MERSAALLKRRLFLQLACALFSAAPWLLRNQSDVAFRVPAEAVAAGNPFRFVRVKLPGGWFYETATMDGPEVLRDWFSCGRMGIPKSEAY